MNDETIKIFINKKEETVDKSATVSQLIRMRGMKKASVWVNGIQLLNSQYDSYVLQENDEVKLLRLIAGG